MTQSHMENLRTPSSTKQPDKQNLRRSERKQSSQEEEHQADSQHSALTGSKRKRTPTDNTMSSKNKKPNRECTMNS